MTSRLKQSRKCAQSGKVLAPYLVIPVAFRQFYTNKWVFRKYKYRLWLNLLLFLAKSADELINLYSINCTPFYQSYARIIMDSASKNNDKPMIRPERANHTISSCQCHPWPLLGSMEAQPMLHPLEVQLVVARNHHPGQVRPNLRVNKASAGFTKVNPLPFQCTSQLWHVTVYLWHSCRCRPDYASSITKQLDKQQRSAYFYIINTLWI